MFPFLLILQQDWFGANRNRTAADLNLLAVVDGAIVHVVALKLVLAGAALPMLASLRRVPNHQALIPT